jgi:hypothetical protein
MKRNSTTLFLSSPGATTPIPWVNNAPDFSAFTEPTLSVLTKAWNDFIDSGEELEIVPDPVPVVEEPVPNWDAFNATMLADVAYNQTVGAVLQIAPAVATGLPTTLAQVAVNGVNSFAILYGAFCQIGQVSAEQRGEWADLAESFNLPQEFVGVLRG